jgi:hypothetical protein
MAYSGTAFSFFTYLHWLIVSGIFVIGLKKLNHEMLQLLGAIKEYCTNSEFNSPGIVDHIPGLELVRGPDLPQAEAREKRSIVGNS